MSGSIIAGGPRVPAELVTDAGVSVESHGDLVIASARTIDFEGDGVSVVVAAGVAVVTIGGGGTNPSDVEVNLNTEVVPGNAVYVPSSGHAALAIASGSDIQANVLGLATEAGIGAGIVRTAGPLTLTLAQWNAITGSSTGLQSGEIYYLDPDIAGHLTLDPPSLAGQIAAPLGLAMSTTTLIINISDRVVLGSGSNVIELINGSGVTMIIGTPVYSIGPGAMGSGLANGTGKANIVGLVADVSIADGAPGSVAVGGVIVATTAQWDAVAGTSGGLAFNTPYYVSWTVPGKLTATPPVSPADDGDEVVQVIVALSATEARIAITAPVELGV